MRLLPAAVLALALPAGPALTQSDFTTPEGAAMIHQSIKDQILSFRPDGDLDYIYFTAILGWRCGVRELRYGLNGAAPDTAFPLEPCHRDLRNPNTMKGDISQFPIFITVPKGSAETVTLRVIYDNGAEARFEAPRARNLIN